MSDYTFTRFTSPNAAPVVSTAGNDLSTAAQNGAALQNLDENAVGLSTADTLNNKKIGTGWTVAMGSDATGDIYYRDSGGNFQRLGVGTSSQFLQGGTTPAWGTPSTAIAFSFFSGINGLAAASTAYMGAVQSATEANVQVPLPKAFTATIFEGHQGAASGSGQSYTYTVRQNAADGPMTFAISGTSQVNNSDLAHSITFAQGDLVAVKYVGSAGAATTTGTFTISS